MSVELLGVVIAAFAVLVTLGIGMFAGFAWIVRRIDRVDDKLSARIDGVEDELSARIHGVEVGLSEVKSELTEVKIAIARFEGPRPHLVVAR
ncbi:hypothetical protein [Microbacterium panaciterrae]|uniref:DUF948 domain-containing protein n=1 Tax=Microbacterium panaciterrae TaxID=985759 RepID=A0ABP8PKL1_9MICO